MPDRPGVRLRPHVKTHKCVPAARLQRDADAHDAMIEIDSDGHRAGVHPDAALLPEIGHPLHSGGARLRGVMTYAGESYALNTPAALAALAEQESARSRNALPRGQRRLDADRALGREPGRRDRTARRGAGGA